jgi:hypothetical protein
MLQLKAPAPNGFFYVKIQNIYLLSATEKAMHYYRMHYKKANFLLFLIVSHGHQEIGG